VCVRAPLVPVIANNVLPSGVADVLDTVIVDVPVVGFGLNATDAPGTLALSVTGPLKPEIGVTDTAYVVDAPWATVRLAGLAESEKSGAGPCTTSVTVVVCDRAPLAPVIVTTELLTGVADVLVTVSVDVPVAGFGLNAAAAPAGSPLALSVTGPLKPEIGVTDTAYVLDAPWAIVRLAGLAESAKSGVETTSVTVVVCVTAPLAPVIVRTELPLAVDADVWIVIVDAPAVGFGLKEEDAPAGRPEALSVTLPLKPPVGVTLTV